ncbi:MAG: ABC transporter substrate-binding protein [Desulfonatronovibrionaceae bacterium]
MKRLTVALFLITLFFTTQAGAETIKIGSMMDLSGPTSSVGQPYAKGLKACVDWINSEGGVAGNKIKLIEVDTGYNVQQGLTSYKRFVNREKVVAIQAFGTAVTEALVRFAKKDRIPLFSASYSAHLTDPAKAPYNFFIAADYSTQMRVALKYFFDNWEKERQPRIAFIYPDHPYGLAPIKGGKKYAQKLGYDIVGEENVGLKAIDATTQLLSLKTKAPDYCWIGGTTPSTAVILKDARKVGLETTFFTNIWGADEELVKMAGDAANGAYSLQSAAVYGQDVAGMEVIEEITDNKPKMTHYIRGFASMLVMAEGVRIAAENEEINGPGIKKALESLRDYDPMGLTPPISFFPDDHRPNMAAFLYRFEDEKMDFTGSMHLERKQEWLGE